MPVFTCTEAAGGGYRYSRFSEPIHVGDMMAEFPDMQVVMLHAGYPFYHWFEESLNEAAISTNMYVQFDFWVYGIAALPNATALTPNFRTNEEAVVRMLHKAKSVVGARCVLFGTDSFQGPSFHDEHSVWHVGLKNLVDWWKSLPETGKKYGCDFTVEEVDLMLGGNAERLLGLEKRPEWEREHKYGWTYRYPSPNHG